MAQYKYNKFNIFCKDGFVHTVKTNTTHSSETSWMLALCAQGAREGLRLAENR